MSRNRAQPEFEKPGPETRKPGNRALFARLWRAVPQLSMLHETMRLIWAASKTWTLIWLILLIVLGVLPGGIVYLTRSLVDGVAYIVNNGYTWERAGPVVTVGGTIAGLMVLSEILASVIDWIRTAQAEFIQDHIRASIHEKTAGIDLAFYETPEYHDLLTRASTEAGSRSLALLENGGSLIQSSITLASMGAILIPYGTMLPALLLLSTLPAFLLVVHFDRRRHNWWKEATQRRRWVQYYDTVLTIQLAAQELRLFGLGAHFRTAYRQLREKLRSESLKMTRDQGVARILAGAFGLLTAGGAMAWMIWRAFMGLASLGDIVLFYQAFDRGQSLMRSLLGNIGKIYTNSLFLGSFFEFLKLESRITDPPTPLQVPSPMREGIRFRDVDFFYPGSRRPALDNFRLHIPAGEIVALIGPNGAGKSTLVKLLCRFYDPRNGSIELDGIDIRHLSIEELRRNITVLLQTPIPYHATAMQNIAYGDVYATPDMEEIEAAAKGAGAHELILRLTDGYDTLLGKSFADGAELSTGEWQRVALARAFYRKAQIIILDEPTSFMDSWSEADWFERLRSLSKGRTTLLITHRFTLAMRADRIHVMQNGQIVESGGHSELLTQGGLYALSWKSQMDGYFEDSSRISI